MIHFDANKSTQLLTITYSGHVSGPEINARLPDVKVLVGEMEPGFRFLIDLGRLDSMEASCAPAIAKIMDAANKKGVAEVGRVIPNPSKDIGFMVMSQFHYATMVKVTTHGNLQDAIESLTLV